MSSVAGNYSHRSIVVLASTSISYVTHLRGVIASLVPVALSHEDREEALCAIQEAMQA